MSLSRSEHIEVAERKRRNAEKGRRYYRKHRERILAQLREKTAASPLGLERRQRSYLLEQEREARKVVLRRDGYHCVDCGRSGELLVHHLDGRSRHSRVLRDGPYNNTPENLVTLCWPCHGFRHEHDPTLPLEERYARKMAAAGAMSAEDRRAKVKKVAETLGPDGLAARSRTAWANLTPELRAVRVKNAAQARQAVRDRQIHERPLLEVPA